MATFTFWFSRQSSYNVLKQFVGGGGGGGEVGVLVLLIFGGVVQNRESPDFRSPEVGRYECIMYD